ncbi:MAG: HlyD family efflux transporter periplasmic adaptor subunit [Halieaceae bacterium]
MGLFRQQAMDAYCDRLHGHVMLLPRLPHTLLCLGLLLWVGLLALFLTQSHYSRRETVSGWLEPAAGVVRIYPQTEGKLAQLLVKNGDPVITGQPLAIINGDRVLTGGEHMETLLLEEYQAQQRALQRQLKREDSLQQSRLGELEQRLQTAASELAGIEAQLTTQQQRIDLARQRQQRNQQLVQHGHITATEQESLLEQLLRLDRERQALLVDRAQQLAVIQQLQSRFDRLPEESANAIDQLRLKLSALSQDIARLRGQRAYVVMATIDGYVSNLSLQAGQRARFNQPLLSLLPVNSGLIAHLLIPVRAAGFLQAGQEVLIRYDAFPYQKFGLQRAQLLAVASNASLPGETLHVPFNFAEPVYRVTAKPDTSSIIAYGKSFPLKAGMTLSADIKLEQRSLLQWLLEPIHSLRGRLS